MAHIVLYTANLVRALLKQPDLLCEQVRQQIDISPGMLMQVVASDLNIYYRTAICNDLFSD